MSEKSYLTSNTKELLRMDRIRAKRGDIHLRRVYRGPYGLCWYQANPDGSVHTSSGLYARKPWLP